MLGNYNNASIALLNNTFYEITNNNHDPVENSTPGL